jgi:hypothetical protein
MSKTTLKFVDFSTIPRRVVYEGWTGHLASSSFRLPSGVRLVDEKLAVTWKGEKTTVGAVVVTWLKERGYKHHPVKRWQEEMMILQPPLYVEPGETRGEDWGYWDIKAAYPSIYKRLRWGDEYVPGLWARKSPAERPLNDFPLMGHKLARNAVIGIARGGRSSYYKEGRLVKQIIMYGFRNMHLIAAIMHIMHDIAAHAVRLGCRYWNTDGGILPTAAGEDLAGYGRDTWGLTIREKHKGRAVIQAPGDYRIGQKKTGTNARRPRPMVKINDPGPADKNRLVWLME